MIRKITKVVFIDGKNKITKELIGGIPLSKGEEISIHRKSKVVKYIVNDKIVDCYIDGKDQNIDITYFLKKK